jgi:hypothetical protein
LAGSAGGAGASTSFVRADHNHAVPVAAPVSASGSANGAGAASTFSRSDHKHALELAIQDEGAAQGVVPTVDFVGAGVTATVAAGKATVTIPGGGASSAVATAESNGTASIGSGSWTDITSMSVAIPGTAGTYVLVFNADIDVPSGSTFRIRLTMDGAEVFASQRTLLDDTFDDEQWPGTIVNYDVLAGGESFKAQVIRDSGAGSITFRHRSLGAFKVA